MPLDEQRAKIQEDLRGLIEGDVFCDEIHLQLYASDASIYQIRPLGVIRPKSVADVVACVQYAAERQLPLHPRGAGTGLAGEALGRGLVLDFSRYMRRILAVRPDRVRVQPGVVLDLLNRRLAPFGRTVGPDPATSNVTSIGSVLAVNAAGSHTLRYGVAGDFVESLEVVLADGQVLEVGREPLPGHRGSEALTGRKRSIVAELVELIRKHHGLIAKHRPHTAVNCSGYNLFNVLEADHFHLARMLCGSEGTLGVITQATIKTIPLPTDRAVALLFFDRLEAAARASLEIREFRPSACDLLDRRLMNLARDTDPRYDLMIPAEAEAALLVEQVGESPGEAKELLAELVSQIDRHHRSCFAWVEAHDSHEIELIWELARKVIPSLYRIKGSARAIPFIEDMAIPPERLPEFLGTLQNVLKKHQVTASLFAHAGHGQLHLRPFLEIGRQEETRRMRALATEIYESVLAVHGTISGEHGDGLSRTAYVPNQYGELYGVFREVKRIFDPYNIFNPGKIIGDDPFLTVRHLRETPRQKTSTVASDYVTPEIVPLQLHWTPAEVANTARACNGCGACRSQLPDVRMCPIFRFDPSEEASPRAKANLMRGIMTGALPPATIADDSFKEVVDLCVNCKMCRSECPAGVNIPKLMLEARAGYVAINGLSLGDWMLSRLETVSAVGSWISPLSNWLISHRQSRWLIEKLLGIAQGRKLPRFARRPFLRRAARRRLTRPTGRKAPKVLYFVDTYANYHDPQLAEAFVALLEHHGIAVYVHPSQKTSGMALITAGALDRARQIAYHNVTLLAEAVRQGYTIVATEPSAIICLQQEYPDLLEDPDAQLVAEHAYEACTYLWKLHREKKLNLQLQPIDARVAYHQPCHTRALQVGSPAESLLRLIPKLKVRAEDHGCSGMAGTFGLKRDKYRMSLRAGWNLIQAMRSSEISFGSAECSACKMQMEQGTDKPTLHPVKLLTYANGLMPHLAEQLTQPGRPLTIS